MSMRTPGNVIAVVAAVAVTVAILDAATILDTVTIVLKVIIFDLSKMYTSGI